MSLFQIKTCFLPKNVEEVEHLLDKMKIYFDEIGISESRTKKHKSPELKIFCAHFYHTPDILLEGHNIMHENDCVPIL